MRKTYLDNIKWMIIVLVVLYHVQSMYSEMSMPNVVGTIVDGHRYLDLFTYIVNPWFMFLMFIISGMSTRYYLEKHSVKEFIKSRTLKLFVPSFVGLLLFGWIHGYYTAQIQGILDGYLMNPDISKLAIWGMLTACGIGQLWFLQVLWLFSLVIALLQCIGINKLNRFTQKANLPILILLGVFVWGMSNILNSSIIDAYRFGRYFSAFIIGYLFLSNDEVIEKMKSRWYVFLIIAIPLGVVNVVTGWGTVSKTTDVNMTVWSIEYCYFMSVAVLVVMAKWGNFTNKFTEFMRKKSWGIYLFHYALIKAAVWYIHSYANGMPVVFKYLIPLVVGFGGSYVLYEVISRVPVLRWCLCGIYKKKTNKVKGEQNG